MALAGYVVSVSFKIVPDLYWMQIYVEFETVEQAATAQQALAGRKYGNRSVLTGFFPEDQYYNKNFEPDRQEELQVAENFRKRQEAAQNQNEQT